MRTPIINKQLTDIEKAIREIPVNGVSEAVAEWLDDHPEATTTVQDGSLTKAKFTNELKLETIKEYVTPEMYGAVGDGETDDTEAVQQAISTGKDVMFDKTYLVTERIDLESGTTIFGNGTIIGSILNHIDTLFMSGNNTSGHEIHDVVIKDITIIAEYSYCIQIYGEGYTYKPYNIRIENVTTISNQHGGVFINSAHDCDVISLRHNGGARAVGTKAPISSPNDCFNIIIQGCRSENTTQFGYQTYYGKNITISNNYCDGSMESAGDQSCITVDRTRRANVIGNICKNAPLTNIFITGVEDVNVVGNVTIGGAYGIQAVQNNEYYNEDSSILENKRVGISGNTTCEHTSKDILVSGTKGATISSNTCEGYIYIMDTTISGGGESVETVSEKISIIGNIANQIQRQGSEVALSSIGNNCGSGMSGIRLEDLVLNKNEQYMNSNLNLKGELKSIEIPDNKWTREYQYPSTGANHYGFIERYAYGQLIFQNSNNQNAFAFDIGINKSRGNFKVYAAGKGIVLTSPDGNTTKLIRLSNAGQIEIVNP